MCGGVLRHRQAALVMAQHQLQEVDIERFARQRLELLTSAGVAIPGMRPSEVSCSWPFIHPMTGSLDERERFQTSTQPAFPRAEDVATVLISRAKILIDGSLV